MKIYVEFNNDPQSISMIMTDANQKSSGPEKMKVVVTQTSASIIEVSGILYDSNATSGKSGFNPFGATGEAAYIFTAIIDSAQNIAKQNMALVTEMLTSVDNNFWTTYPISKAFINALVKFLRESISDPPCLTLGYALQTAAGNTDVPANVCTSNTAFTDAQMETALKNYINSQCASSSSGLCELKYVFFMDNSQCLTATGFSSAGANCNNDTSFSTLSFDSINPMIPSDIKALSLPDITCVPAADLVPDVTFP